MLSVGGAVLALLVIAFLYNRNSREGMGTGRAAARPMPGQKSIMDHVIAFFTFTWLLEMLGLSKPKPATAVSSRARAGQAARNLRGRARSPSARASTGGATARGPAGAAQRARAAAAKNPAAAAKRVAQAKQAAAKQAVAKRAAVNRAAVNSGKQVATEGFRNMRRRASSRGRAWKPRGAIAFM